MHWNGTVNLAALFYSHNELSLREQYSALQIALTAKIPPRIFYNIDISPRIRYLRYRNRQNKLKTRRRGQGVSP